MGPKQERQSTLHNLQVLLGVSGYSNPLHTEASPQLLPDNKYPSAHSVQLCISEF